jgi:hypothetical protein
MQVLKRLRSGSFSGIPPRCGAFMQGLIHRCWAQNPDDRPSFSDIMVEFEGRDFDLFPGCKGDEIRAFCDGVVRWENERRT